MENRIFHLRYSVASLVGIRSLRLSVLFGYDSGESDGFARVGQQRTKSFGVRL